MRNPYLAEEAALFAKNYEVRLNDAKVKLFQAATRFLNEVGSAVLPIWVVEGMKCCIEKGDVVSLGLSLRHEASLFAQSDSSKYWPLVDNLLFFHDAIGTHWKYLSLERRLQYLVWVEEFLNEQDGAKALVAA